MTDTTDAAGLSRHERHLQIMDGVTLTLLAVGAALMVVLVRRPSLEAVLIAIAGLMLGVSTILSIRRRRAGGETVTKGRSFGLGFILRIAPNLLILAALALSFARDG